MRGAISNDRPYRVMALEPLQFLAEQINQLDRELATLLHPHQDAVQQRAEVQLPVMDSVPLPGKQHTLPWRFRSVGCGLFSRCSLTQIFYVYVSSETNVICQIPTWVIRILVNNDLVAIPIPVRAK